jgi:hypothetical protein
MIFFSLAVSHAEETPDDMSADQFLLECVWTGDRHHNAHACGGFPTRALCEREERSAVANGELLSFNCDSPQPAGVDAEETTDDATVAFGSVPSAPDPINRPGNSLGGQAVGGIGNFLAHLQNGGFMGNDGSPTRYGPTSSAPTFAQRPLAPQARPGGFIDYLGPGNGQIVGLDAMRGLARSPGWAKFERNARPSNNIEDFRRTRGKPFIAQ